MADGKIRAAAVVQLSFEEHNAHLFLALATAVQGKRIGNSEEHRSQQRT